MVPFLLISLLTFAILLSQPVRFELAALPPVLTLLAVLLVHASLPALGISDAAAATPALVLPLATGLLVCLALVAKQPEPVSAR